MPRPADRTRSRKRVPKPLPGGEIGTKFKDKIGAISICSRCGQQLAGISHSSIKTRKLNRGRKRVERLHGGQLCHNCLKIALRQAARTV